MKNEDINEKYRDKFQLIFVGMFWRNDTDPVYKDWTEGRIEIRTVDDGGHANDEIRFCTKKTTEWFEFQDKHSGMWVTASELENIKRTVEDKFKKSLTNPN
jgi:hypothetical protein